MMSQKARVTSKRFPVSVISIAVSAAEVTFCRFAILLPPLKPLVYS